MRSEARPPKQSTVERRRSSRRPRVSQPPLAIAHAPVSSPTAEGPGALQQQLQPGDDADAGRRGQRRRGPPPTPHHAAAAPETRRRPDAERTARDDSLCFVLMMMVTG